MQLICAGFLAYQAMHGHSTEARIVYWLCAVGSLYLQYYRLTQVKNHYATQAQIKRDTEGAFEEPCAESHNRQGRRQPDGLNNPRFGRFNQDLQRTQKNSRLH